MMTGHGEEAFLESTGRAGADAFLRKQHARSEAATVLRRVAGGVLRPWRRSLRATPPDERDPRTTPGRSCESALLVAKALGDEGSEQRVRRPKTKKMDPRDLANRLKLIAAAINRATHEGADKRAFVEEVIAGRIKDADDVPKVARELLRQRAFDGGSRQRSRTRRRPGTER